MQWLEQGHWHASIYAVSVYFRASHKKLVIILLKDGKYIYTSYSPTTEHYLGLHQTAELRSLYVTLIRSAW